MNEFAIDVYEHTVRCVLVYSIYSSYILTTKKVVKSIHVHLFASLKLKYDMQS